MRTECKQRTEEEKKGTKVKKVKKNRVFHLLVKDENVNCKGDKKGEEQKNHLGKMHRLV